MMTFNLSCNSNISLALLCLSHRLFLYTGFSSPLPPVAVPSVTQTHLRQPTSDAEVAEPVDSVHHTSTSSSSSSYSSVQVCSQHTHTATVAFHLASASATRVSPQLPLCGWVCAPGALLRWLGRLQCVMNHLDSDSCSLLQYSKKSDFQVTVQLRWLKK